MLDAMRSAIIADDLTGACDSAARAALAGWRLRVVLDDAGWSETAEITILSTASRNLPAAEAAARTAEAAHALLKRGVPPVFKKIDSTLRGPWVAEVAALRDVIEPEVVAVCPAFPACGRVVREGIVYSDGEAIGPLAPILAAAGVVEARIGDASSEEELAAFAAAIRASAPPCGVLWVGSAGLAQFAFGEAEVTAEAQSAQRERRENREPGLPRARHWLVLAGSTHPATLAQVDVARRAGICVVDRLPDAILEGTGLFLIGGDTAENALRELGAQAIEVLGEALPGIAAGRLVGGRADGAAVLTKVGGFGGPDAVLRAMARSCAA